MAVPDAGRRLASCEERLPDGSLLRRELWSGNGKERHWIHEHLAPAANQPGPAPPVVRYAASRVIVSLDDLSRRGLRQLGLSARPLGPPRGAREGVLDNPFGPAPDCVARLLDLLDAAGISAVADHRIEGAGDAAANDPDFPLQWALANNGADGARFGADINIDHLWQITTDASTVPVAVIDSGADPDHPEFAGQWWTNPGEIPGNGIDDDGNGLIDDVHGWDFHDHDAVANDTNGHGTHVAGIIGACGNNGAGSTGVAWKAAIVPLKFLGPDLQGNTSDAIAAIRTAIDYGTPVMNLSWGSTTHNALLFNALRDASNAGMLIVAAAGNGSRNLDAAPVYPAAYGLDHLLAVASSDARGRLAVGSNFGPERVHLAAPGRSIWSTDVGGGFRFRSGTSMAAPHVAGVAALLRAATGADAGEIRAALEATAIPLPDGPVIRHGGIDASLALATLAPALGVPPLPARWQSSKNHSPGLRQPSAPLQAPLFTGLPDGITQAPLPHWLSGRHATAGDFAVEYTFPVAAGSACAKLDWRVIDLPERWKSAKFPPGGTQPPFAWLADPDGDGRSNLFEYLVGAHPLEPDSTLPEPLHAESAARLAIRLAADMETPSEGDWHDRHFFRGLELRLETSPDGAVWLPVPPNLPIITEIPGRAWSLDPRMLLSPATTSLTRLFRIAVDVPPSQ